MVPQGIPPKFSGVYNDNFSKGVQLKLKAKGDCISEAFFIGQITGGINFKSSDGLFCEIVLDVGPHWNLIRGAQQRNENSQNDFKGIQTQTAYAEEGQMFVWSHPIDLEFKVGNINGWQQTLFNETEHYFYSKGNYQRLLLLLHFYVYESKRPKGVIKVWRLDDTNKIDAISYGVVNFPREDGYHRLEVETWSPMGDWQFSNFSFFLGAQPRLPNLDMSKLVDKRNEILGVSSGKVILEIEVILRNFNIIDVTGQEKQIYSQE